MQCLSSLAIAVCAVLLVSSAGGRSLRASPFAPGIEAPPDVCGSAAQTVGRPDVQRWGAIEGHVLGEQRRPLAGATVSAQRVRLATTSVRLVSNDATPPAGSASAPQLTMVTNSQGEYRLERLPPGQYYVSAVLKTSNIERTRAREARGRSERVGYGPTFYPGTTYLAQASPVRVRPGDEVTSIDVTLEKERLARVSGGVVSMRGRFHMDGASVALVPSPALGGGGLVGFLGHSLISAAGTFSIEQVPPGEYLLKAQSIPARIVQEMAMTGSSEPLTRDPESEFGTLSLTVDGEDIEGISVALSTLGRLRGRVTLDGQPFAPRRQYVFVTAQPVDPDSLAPGASEVRIQADGTFTILGLVGRFVLRVGEIAPALTLARVEMSGSDVTDAGLIVRPREDVSDIEIVLSSRPTELTGRIVAGTSRAPGPCRVIAFSDDANRWSWTASRYVASTPPEPGGVFSITGLPPGTYLVIAVNEVEDEQWLDPQYLRQVSSRATKVTLLEGESRTLTLRLE
jgi:hypothetical protein